MSKQKQLEVVQMAVDDIFPYEKNPRINDGAVDAVAESIREFGFQQPIVVDKNHVIIAGHTRLKAAKKLGLKTVPVTVADLSDEQAKAYRLADNKVAELAEWDISLLDLELEDISLDMELFGFEPKEEAPVEVVERELPPYRQVHYLISCDINMNDQIVDLLETLKGMDGVEIDSTLN